MLLSLCISASDTITFNAVQNATTDKLPTGDAKKAWQNIFEINQPAIKADQQVWNNSLIIACYKMKLKIQINGFQN
jgi:hypothetical protein